MTVLKSIVVCLALANVFYFLWAHGIAEQAESHAPEPAPPGTLKLVSEVPEAQRTAQADGSGIAGSSSLTADASDGSGAPLASARRCLTVGPFRDVAEASHTASALRAGGYDPRQRVVDGEVWAGVWVYLPLPAGVGAGDQLLAKLKAAGMDDALEMPGPNEGSVISLGLYSEQKRAQARVQQAQALGLTPQMADRKRTGNVYWIDIDLKPSDGLLNPAQLQTEAGRISRLEIKSCESTPAAP
jgi:hypothetical protein